jgi:hypothetical protein
MAINLILKTYGIKKIKELPSTAGRKKKFEKNSNTVFPDIKIVWH